MIDLGPGDCVEAVRNLSSLPGTKPGLGYYEIDRGTRAIIGGLSTAPGTCVSCRQRGPGFTLIEYPLIEHVWWCHCEWRRVGGDKDAHVRQFADYLRQRDAEVIRRLVRTL